jgi:uncharacterized protein (DUF488 family)
VIRAFARAALSETVEPAATFTSALQHRSKKMEIFTIGHSNHDLEKFLQLLKANKIEALVDIRSNPYSRYAYQFNKDNLTKAIQAGGLKYLFLGKKLGGRPKDRQFYDSEGHVLYSRLSESPLFLEGIERVINEIETSRVALMCSEENPVNCHRYLLVSKFLEDRGISVLHIRGDGRIQSKDDLSRENEKLKGKEQQSLFRFRVAKAQEWKSNQSVL